MFSLTDLANKYQGTVCQRIQTITRKKELHQICMIGKHRQLFTTTQLEGATLRVMVDSRAIGNYISLTVVAIYRIVTQQKTKPYQLSLANSKNMEYNRG